MSEMIKISGRICGEIEFYEATLSTALFCMSFLRKGEVLAYVGLPQNRKEGLLVLGSTMSMVKAKFVAISSFTWF